MNWKSMAVTIAASIVLSPLGTGLAADAPVTPAGRPLAYTTDCLIEHVPVLKHSLGDRLPTLLWGGQPPLAWTNATRLKWELTELQKRGICVYVFGGNYSLEIKPEIVSNQIAEAKAIQTAGFPVNILVNGGWDLYYAGPTHVGTNVTMRRHAEASTNAAHVGFPCLTLRTGWAPAEDYMRRLLTMFKDAGVMPAGVWYDYEGWPHPWNGVYESMQACPACRKEAPAGVLSNREAFGCWAFELRSEALNQTLAQPVRDLFPKALAGQYGSDGTTDPQHPVVDGLGLRHPVVTNKTLFHCVMPSTYAWGDHVIKRYFNADWPRSQDAFDELYFYGLLADMRNYHYQCRRDGLRLVPYISGDVNDHPTTPRMSRRYYREFLRHSLLRGVSSFFAFNPGPPYLPLATWIEEAADINIVYNEMLAYRDLLDKGEILNDVFPSYLSKEPIWSGVRVGDEALIRTFCFGSQPVFVNIVPFDGVAVKLLASSAGNTYRVKRSGEVESLD